MRLIFPILTCLSLIITAAYADMPARSPLTVDYKDRNTNTQITGTDIGRFQEGEDNVVIVPDGTDDTVVCRFRSPDGNCFRLSVNDGKGHVPVPLIDRATFDNFAEQFKARPDWGICEIIANPWSNWQVVGQIPTAPGTHSYLEQRFCSTGGNPNACPDTCPTPSETRTQTITNVCTNTSWSPPQSSYYNDQLFWQTSNCGDTRQVYGSVPRPACNPNSWQPSPATYYTDTRFVQVNECGDERYMWGTVPRCDENSWTPATDAYYQGVSFTQTNGCGHTRPAVGTKVNCTDTTWSPDPSTVTKGVSFIQTSNCNNTRPATGTFVSCTPNWQPPASNFYTDETFTQSDGCGNSKNERGTKTRPVSCTPRAPYFSGGILFRYRNGQEGWVEYMSASSLDQLQRMADAYINQVTGGGSAIEFVDYWLDVADYGQTC